MIKHPTFISATGATRMVSHINDLPADLLVRIFKECVSSDLYTQFFHDSLLPARLLRVCKKWNSIALTIPILWTSLFIGSAIAFDGDLVLDMIERRLRRTEDLEIALSIGFEPGAFTWNRPLNLPWWKVAHLELEDENLHPRQAWGILSECVNLKTCSLLIDGFVYVDDGESSDEEESGGRYTSGPEKDCSDEENSDRGSGSGEEDTRSDYELGDEAHPGNDREVVILPGLEMLSIVFDSQLFDDRIMSRKAQLNQPFKDSRAPPPKARISPFFDRCELPALKDLTVAATHSAVDNDLLMALIDLSVLSCFQLTSLDICNIRVEVGNLHRFLLNLTTLENLRVRSPNFGQSLPDLVEHLEYIPAKASMNILPRLETLTILDHVLPRDHRAIDEISLRVLESRWWADKPHRSKLGLSRLRRVNITWDGSGAACYSDAKLSSERVEVLRSQGMVLAYPTLD